MAIADKVLTRRFLRRGARYGRKSGSSGLERDGRSLAIASKVLTRRLLRRGARYGRKSGSIGLRRDGQTLAIASKVFTRRLLRRGARYGRKSRLVTLSAFTGFGSLRLRPLCTGSGLVNGEPPMIIAVFNSVPQFALT